MSQTWDTFNEDSGGDSVYAALLDQRTRTDTIASMWSGSSAPSSPTPADGSKWLDTTGGAEAFKVYIGGGWREVCVVGYTQLTTAEIGDATITAVKLATDAVSEVKVLDGAITTAKLATDSVETAKITDANVTAAKLAADAVETAKIKDANVTAAKLATDSVETAKIKDGAVTAAKMSGGAGGWNVSSKSGDYTAVASDYLAVTVTSTWTLTLPASPSAGDQVGVHLVSVSNGEYLIISGSHDIGHQPHGATIRMVAPMDHLELIFSGSKWLVVAMQRCRQGGPDVVLEDQKAASTHGGTRTADTWMHRDLNTLVRPLQNAVTLASNQFTVLQDGWVEWSSAMHHARDGRSRLYCVTDAAAVTIGDVRDTQYAITTYYTGGGEVERDKTYRIETWSSSGMSSHGLGVALTFWAGYTNSGTAEIYTRVKYWRN